MHHLLFKIATLCFRGLTVNHLWPKCFIHSQDSFYSFTLTFHTSNHLSRVKSWPILIPGMFLSVLKLIHVASYCVVQIKSKSKKIIKIYSVWIWSLSQVISVLRHIYKLFFFFNCLLCLLFMPQLLGIAVLHWSVHLCWFNCLKKKKLQVSALPYVVLFAEESLITIFLCFYN